jgi:glycerate kinase
VRDLDAALANYAEVIARDLRADVAEIPGAGASGGLGAGLVGFFDARLRLGADIVLDAVNIDAHLPDADLVIVGEGQFDRSTVFNKSPVAVAQRAKKHDRDGRGVQGHSSGEPGLKANRGIGGPDSVTGVHRACPPHV